MNTPTLRVEVDHGSTSAKGQPPGRVWLVLLGSRTRSRGLTSGFRRRVRTG